MNVRIIGVQHFSSSNSKRFTRPYDFCIIHCVSCERQDSVGDTFSMNGYRVYAILCDTSRALDLPIPCFADVCRDFDGSIKDLCVLEGSCSHEIIL